MVAVVIPWRPAPGRQRGLDWVIAKYRSTFPDWQIVVAEHEGEWCKALALRAAVPDCDRLVISDADCWSDAVGTSVEALGASCWSYPHRTVRRLSPGATETLLAGGTPSLVDLDEPASRAWAGGGIVCLRREVWDEVPLDHRFVGWGHEDQSWGFALRTLAGPPPKPTGTLLHLWHPPQPRPSRYFGSAESLDLYRRYEAACGKPDEMRSLLAEVADGCRTS